MSALYLDEFQKKYSGNVLMGESFFAAVLGMNFDTKVTKFPHVRIALVATNLISPESKILDGTAKLVVKGDMTVLCRKDRFVQVTAAENMMSDAWRFLQEGVKHGLVDSVKAVQPFGLVQTRIILFLLKKQKFGVDETPFETMADIKTAFDTAIDQPKATASPPKPQETEAVEAKAYGLTEVSDPVWIAAQAGYKIGARFVNADSQAVYSITAMDGNGVTFTLEDAVYEKVEKMIVKFDLLKKTFGTLCKAKPHKKLERCEEMPQLMPSQHKLLKLDTHKAIAFQELMSIASMLSDFEMEAIDYFFNPSEVRARMDLQSGKLQLGPFTELSRLVAKSVTTTYVATGAGEYSNWFIDAPQRPKTDDVESWPDRSLFSAFWSVKTGPKSEANMKIVKMKVQHYTFPVLQNSKAIKKGTVLMLPEPEAAAPSAKKARS